MPNSPDFYRYVTTALVVGLVLVLRLRRVGKMRRMRIETLWIVPAIFVALVAVMFYEAPPQGLDWLWCALALLAGGAIGWQRGRFVEIHVDPATHELNQRASIASVVFIFALMAMRFGLRYLMEMGDARWHFGALLITALFMSFAVGVIGFFRVEMYLRARRLLMAARAA